MNQRTLLVWSVVHRWTSLISTAFLLMLCVTGLPLIFHHEIDVAMGQDHALVGPASSGSDARLLPLDAILARALDADRGSVPLFMAFDNHSPLITVTTAPTVTAVEDEMTLQFFDRTTGKPVGLPGENVVTEFLLELHTDMFLGLPGMLFLGAMGTLFVGAIVSGVVLYAPFMRKLDFGTVRVGRSRRLKWLDYHNLLGIVAVAWMSVVGLTGIINALATPIVKAWQATELADMTRAYARQPALALPPARRASLDAAMAAARTARPGNVPQFIGFPGGGFSSAHHYAIFFQGDTPLTERMLTPALIDAATGQLTDVRPLPWYVSALLVSQPLHFGDYGALPLKLLWAILDVFTIVVLGSGLYLWRARGRSPVEAG